MTPAGLAVLRAEVARCEAAGAGDVLPVFPLETVRWLLAERDRLVSLLVDVEVRVRGADTAALRPRTLAELAVRLDADCPGGD